MSAVVVLESLLARVQQRSSQPRRAGSHSVPRLATPAPVAKLEPLSPAPEPFSSSPIAFSPRDRTPTRQLQRVRQPPVPVDDGVEEYDEELIELVDDSETFSEAPVPSSAGATLQLDDPLEDLAEPPARSSRRDLSAAELSPELVRRPDVPPTVVAAAIGERPSIASSEFVVLLDLSLRLGE